MDYERILVFGAHPDDEIAMAGTMAKLSSQEVTVVVATFTNGCEGYPRPEMKGTIVEMRRREMAECDKVLGISRRVCFDIPDMALVNDKQTFTRCVALIREVRPDAIFTHGPHEIHRDHKATHEIVREAKWQAGEPVCAELGEPWLARHLYYYKAVRDQRPCIIYDVSETAYKRLLALASQVSQHTLFGKTREQFEAEAEQMRLGGGRHTETFWPAETEVLNDFLA